MRTDAWSDVLAPGRSPPGRAALQAAIAGVGFIQEARPWLSGQENSSLTDPEACPMLCIRSAENRWAHPEIRVSPPVSYFDSTSRECPPTWCCR